MRDFSPKSLPSSVEVREGRPSEPRGFWNGVAAAFYTPAPITERHDEDGFVPSHPEPRTQDPNLFQIVLGARHSLIDNWVVDNYRSGLDSFRILKRQIVLVNSPEHIKHVLVTRHDNFERKSPQMRRALEALLGDGLFISDGETWKRRRPLVADIVHKRRVPEFGATMEDAALNLAKAWSSLPDGAEIELTSEMARLTAAIISRAVFGKNLSQQAAGQVIDGFTTYQEASDSFNLGYFLGWDNGWPSMGGRKRKRAIEMVHEVIDGVVSAHIAGEGDAGSMVDLLIRRNRRAGSDLDVTALRNEAATIFMAGHETTATTLTWAWYLLANSPLVTRRLLDEIESACGRRPPTLNDLPRIPLARAVIQETLRLYPPVPLLPRQALEADQIGHIAVEKSALIMIAPWLLHRSNDLWVKPNHFIPERFLDERKINPFAYIPFAVGPRICPGMNFGLDEAVLCLAILAQQFEIAPRHGYKVAPVCRLTLRPHGGLPATVRRRTCRQPNQ